MLCVRLPCVRAMKAFSWTEAPHGAIVVEGKRLEAAAFGPSPETGPTLVLLHEGLGCVALWREFPERLARGDRLRRIRLLARRLRPLGSGRSATSARLHDARGPLQPSGRPRRDRFPARASWSATATGPRSRRSMPASMQDERVKGLVLIAPHLFTEEPGLASIAEAEARLRDGRPAREARKVSRARG